MRRISIDSRPAKLLVSRNDAAEMLGGISTATVIRMEREGRLHPHRLTGKKHGQVFYKASDLEALIEEAAE